MKDENLNRDFANALRTIASAIELQERLLQGLYRSHVGLVEALLGDVRSSETPAIGLKAVERARDEIRRLEELFGLDGSPVVEPEPPEEGTTDLPEQRPTSFN